MHVTTIRDSLFDVTHQFMARNYFTDVVELNQLVKKKRAHSANLRTDIPPIPFTGNPWNKENRNCMLFIGINPRYQSSDNVKSHHEFGPAIESIERFHNGDDSGFSDYLNQRNFNLIGPVPADTAFTSDSLKKIDVVLAMYHDQGLPVLKAKGFKKAANITLGLPFIRTSVDHGTALNLAGTGNISLGSFNTALSYFKTLKDNATPS